MAEYQYPGRCMVCGGTMHVTRLKCDTCESELTGRFAPCRFCSLDPEMLAFLEVFIKNRGSIKDIERELGVSYPTVRGNLDNLLLALGYGDKATQPRKPSKKEILNQLAKKEISSADALEMLKECDKNQSDDESVFLNGGEP